MEIDAIEAQREGGIEMAMDDKNLLTIAAIEVRKEKGIEIENLESHSGCSIYKVPEVLRRVNEEAFTPQVISIGPLHHGKPGLLDMEKLKIRYKRKFSERINVERRQELLTFIEEHEQRIRYCYEEMPKFQKLSFITMILYDAIFIIELFLRYHEEVKNDFLLRINQVLNYIFRDLQLLENQLPYFILEGLYNLAFSKLDRDGNRYPSFFSLSLNYFFLKRINETPENVKVNHFVDLRRHIMIMTYPRQSSIEDFPTAVNFPTAVKLHESGLKFKGIDEGKGWLLDIKLEKKKQCNCIPIPRLGIHELQIPRIEVYDELECLIRNVMALEQCQYPFETHVCNYIRFMDNLISTEEDVNLLIQEGIISNHVGDTARIKFIFNNLCKHITLSPSCYYDIVNDLKAHYENPWNHAKATLKRVYFRNLWRGTATVAVIVFLLLTLIKIIFTIL